MALSVDLAKLASGDTLGKGSAAQESVSQVSTAKSVARTAPTKWQVPKWQGGFELEGALDKAYDRAVRHMNGYLEEDGLKMDLTVEEDAVIAQVTEVGTDKIVKEYAGLDVLRLYTHNVKEKGIVVDGAL